MAFLRIENIGANGIITDLIPSQLVNEAFTDGCNVRFDHNKVIKFSGHQLYFDPGATWDGGATAQIYHLLPVADGTDYYWMFLGLKDAGVFDASTKTTEEITQAGVDFTATETTVDWTSCIIGGVPVVNNGVDLPQMWTPSFGPATKLADLTDFSTVASKCGALRAFKNYLVALDVTQSGTRYPGLVMWSDSSALGSVPASWSTGDFGQTELAGTRTDPNVGVALDCLPLRDVNIIYKDDSVWQMSFIGGTLVFDFRMILASQGMLARRCAAEFEGKHFFVSQGDVFVHDGANFISVIDEKRKDYLFDNMDPTLTDKTFVFANYPESEMWVCYVKSGSGDTRPNEALVWNWRHKSWGCRDLPSNTAFIEGGIADTTPAADLWSTNDGNWSPWAEVWGSLSFSQQQASPVFATEDALKGDSTNQFSGVSFLSRVERTDIQIGSQDEFVRIKAVYPRMTGGAVDVFVGAQKAPGEPASYQTSVSFTPGTDQKVDARVTGTHFALKVQETSNNTWELSGIDVEYEPISRR